MNTTEIIVAVLFLIYIISIPYLKRYRVYQFCSLLIMPFIICYLFYSLTQQADFSPGRIIPLFPLLLGGLVYQSITFYNRYLKGE